MLLFKSMEHLIQHRNKVLRRFTLQYSTHFSSPVAIRLKNHSLLFQEKHRNTDADLFLLFLLQNGVCQMFELADRVKCMHSSFYCSSMCRELFANTSSVGRVEFTLGVSKFSSEIPDWCT